ncbi:hypothetical protein LY76DRAFT_292888 [Colletotrichum caudatum]|nr:hypothetical protein LY76DRAFT_292888 [Colletotrichum caudatum]
MKCRWPVRARQTARLTKPDILVPSEHSSRRKVQLPESLTGVPKAQHSPVPRRAHDRPKTRTRFLFRPSMLSSVVLTPISDALASLGLVIRERRAIYPGNVISSLADEKHGRVPAFPRNGVH